MIKFSSGRHIEPNCGFVGINVDLELSQGYDQYLYIPTEEWEKDYAVRQFDAKDARELADVMIARWQEFKKKFS